MRLSNALIAFVLGAFSSIASAQITGRVMFKGEPPEAPVIADIAKSAQCGPLHKDPVYDDSIVVSDNKEVANVIVFIKPADGHKLAGPKKVAPAVLDQQGCMYSPRILAVQVGQPLIAKSGDAMLHNVHALAIDNAGFNLAQPAVGQMNLPAFTTPEIVQMKCDVHSWMKAIIRVFDHPYFAVTGPDGKFIIDARGLPDGTYTIDAWHEVFHDAATQTVTIKAGKADKELEFTFQPKTEKSPAKP